MVRAGVFIIMLGALCVGDGPAFAQAASSQNYLSAILRGSPAQRAAEARDRNAARRPDGAATDKPKGRRRGGMPGMGQ